MLFYILKFGLKAVTVPPLITIGLFAATGADSGRPSLGSVVHGLGFIGLGIAILLV